MKQHPQIKIFLKDLKKQCKENNVNLKLVKKYSIREDGTSIGGSFGGDKKMTLTTAIHRPDFLNILIHESCHMDQYLKDEKIWKKGDSYNELYNWLHRCKKILNIKKHLRNVQDIELDCEKRAVRKIKKYKLPIKISEYIQQANAYVYFFSYIKYSRRWPSATKSPYVIDAIWKEMPKHFLKSYRKMPKHLFQLYKQHL